MQLCLVFSFPSFLFFFLFSPQICFASSSFPKKLYTICQTNIHNDIQNVTRINIRIKIYDRFRSPCNKKGNWFNGLSQKLFRLNHRASRKRDMSPNSWRMGGLAQYQMSPPPNVLDQRSTLHCVLPWASILGETDDTTFWWVGNTISNVPPQNWPKIAPQSTLSGDRPTLYRLHTRRLFLTDLPPKVCVIDPHLKMLLYQKVLLLHTF